MVRALDASSKDMGSNPTRREVFFFQLFQIIKQVFVINIDFCTQVCFVILVKAPVIENIFNVFCFVAAGWWRV